MTTVNNTFQNINDYYQKGDYLNICDAHAVAEVVEPLLDLDEFTQRRIFNLIQTETGVDLKKVYLTGQFNMKLAIRFQKKHLKIKKCKDEFSVSKNLKIKNHFFLKLKNEKSKLENNQNKMMELQKGYMKLLSI